MRVTHTYINIEGICLIWTFRLCKQLTLQRVHVPCKVLLLKALPSATKEKKKGSCLNACNPRMSPRICLVCQEVNVRIHDYEKDARKRSRLRRYERLNASLFIFSLGAGGGGGVLMYTFTHCTPRK